MEYVWREVDTPDWISSIDVRHSIESSSASLKKSGPDNANIDVVLGHAQGSINVYHDLFNNLVRHERQKVARNTGHLSSRSMHWHREDVLSVKWTPDSKQCLCMTAV